MNKRSAFAKLGWKGLAILGIVYLVLPIDFIPDLIPVLGLADDLTVIALVAKAAIQLFLKEKHAAPLPIPVRTRNY